MIIIEIFSTRICSFIKDSFKRIRWESCSKKAKDQSAEAIQDFNKRVLLDIADSEDIPDYLKEVMETLPWIRVSKILSESLDELVDELTVFILN